MDLDDDSTRRSTRLRRFPASLPAAVQALQTHTRHRGMQPIRGLACAIVEPFDEGHSIHRGGERLPLHPGGE